MIREERDVSVLSDYWVVEIGCRQAWPFVTFRHDASDREVRLYIDSSVRVMGATDEVFDQEDDELLRALGQVLNSTVRSAEVTEAARLVIPMLDGVILEVSGTDNSITTTAPWWFGLVSGD